MHNTEEISDWAATIKSYEGKVSEFYRKLLALKVLQYCKEFNPWFDGQKFLRECGITE